MNKVKISLSFICVMAYMFTSWGSAYAASGDVFYTEPKGYPKSVTEGIKMANEYAAKKLKRIDKDNPLYLDVLAYDAVEDNKSVSGTVYLNHLYEFSSSAPDKKLPDALKGQAYTNNVMEKLLDKNAFSIIYGYPSTDRKGDEPRYLGRSVFGQRYSNIFFPPDSTSSTAYIEDKPWVKKPWEGEPVYKQINCQTPDSIQKDVILP